MSGTDQADLLIRGTVVDVLAGTLEDRVIAVEGSEIIGYGERPAQRELEAEYVTPGLINAHMHIESTMVTFPHYSNAVVPQGVTTVIADPHEIANVLGTKGIHALIRDAAQSPLKVRFTVPSSVPATPLQDAGATLGPEAVTELLDLDEVVGLAEVMDIDAVVDNNPKIHAKIEAARERELTVDGHLSGITGGNLQEAARYLDTDHESRTIEAAREKLSSGLRLHLRQGSSSKNLHALMPLIDKFDTRQLALCTDNFYATDLIEHAGIDEIVQSLIDEGYDPIEVLQMASLNAAVCYNLSTGVIAPGAPADLVLLSDLDTWTIDHVLIDGVVDPIMDRSNTPPVEFSQNTVQFNSLDPHNLAHSAIGNGNHYIRVIDHTDETTQEMFGTVPSTGSVLLSNTTDDLLPAAVVERHGKDAGIGTGFVHGFGLNRGAIASTVAHDAHNLIVVGVTHEAMARTANHLQAVGGGMAVYDSKTDEMTTMALPVAGLMTDTPVETVATRLQAIQRATDDIGNQLAGGIMELDNLSLEVIPELRLTNNGLVDVCEAEYVDVVIDHRSNFQ